jgi:hypothetical protein
VESGDPVEVRRALGAIHGEGIPHVREGVADSDFEFRIFSEVVNNGSGGVEGPGKEQSQHESIRSVAKSEIRNPRLKMGVRFNEER